MDLGNSTVKTPEAEIETPTRIQPAKPSPFSNGVLKRHAPLNLHHHHHHHPVVITYKECLKNHAASLGGHALDGCGEFMPSPASDPAEPTSLKCAACGCHRNFHRREPDEPSPPPPSATLALEYQPHHRHHPPPPRDNSGSSPNNSPSPPPISSSYYPSAPHMLLALSHGLPGPPPDNINPQISISAAMNATSAPMLSSSSRKRFRTKFTQYQKEKMLDFSDKVGWKMQKRDEDVINEFCNEIGVDRGVFKVWMHNNKHNFGKKGNPPPETTANGNGVSYSGGEGDAYRHQLDGDTTTDVIKQDLQAQETSQHPHLPESTTAQALGTNGSSSSS